MLARYARWWGKIADIGFQVRQRQSEGWRWSTLVFVVVWLGSVSDGYAQQLQHAIRAGGDVSEESRGIAVDADGVSYVIGSFSGSATFGAGEPRETILTSMGTNVFIAKYEHTGRLVWASQVEGDFSEGSDIAVDSAGQSYVVGVFQGTVTFGAGELHEQTLVSANIAFFIAQYDPDGRLLWATDTTGGEIQSSGTGRSPSIAVDTVGNASVTGAFLGMVIFGAGETQETTLASAGGQDIFVAQYDNTGRLVWAVRAGGADADGGSGIAVNLDGDSYVTGSFQGAAVFGSGEAQEKTLTSVGDGMFVAKFDPDGHLVWATEAEAENIGSSGLAVDQTGNSYVTGAFRGTVTFGLGEAHETTFSNVSGLDIFVARYDADGHVVWAARVEGSGFALSLGIAVDLTGNSYVTGGFLGALTFGAGESRETTFTSSAKEADMFVARYDAAGHLMWAARTGGTDVEAGSDIAVDGGGRSYVTGIFSGAVTFGAGQQQKTTLTSAGDTDMFVAVFANVDDPCATAQPTRGCTVNGKPQQLCVGDPSRAANTIIGTSGSDVIIGTLGKDTLKGLGGDDLLCGAGGNDSLNGGDGDDILISGEGNDSLTGERGQDTLDGGAGKDKLNGGPDADTCTGGESVKNC